MATRYGHLACCFVLLRAGASLAPRQLPSGNRSPADCVRTRRLSVLDAVDPILVQAAHKAGADNCDGRVAEQARAIRFVRRVEARGGIKRWCAAEVFELARLRALVARHRAYAFFPPYLACLTPVSCPTRSYRPSWPV